MSAAEQLLISYKRLLLVKSIPYGWGSNEKFIKEVESKIKYIKKQERVK